MSMMIRRHKMQNNKAGVSKAEAPVVDEKPIVSIYNKTEIARMAKADLVDLAKEYDIEKAETMSGNALKDAIIGKLGL